MLAINQEPTSEDACQWQSRLSRSPPHHLTCPAMKHGMPAQTPSSGGISCRRVNPSRESHPQSGNHVSHKNPVPDRPWCPMRLPAPARHRLPLCLRQQDRADTLAATLWIHGHDADAQPRQLRFRQQSAHDAFSRFRDEHQRRGLMPRLVKLLNERRIGRPVVLAQPCAHLNLRQARSGWIQSGVATASWGHHRSSRPAASSTTPD